MNLETFSARFARSAELARDGAREVVLEDLPDAMLFRLRLNSSYDGHPLRDREVRYAEDDTYERARAVRKCDLQAAIGELWRDGRVPEWIDLGVIGRTDTATILEAVAAGRFTDDDDLLYHAWLGAPPFQPVGPAVPHWREEGRFSIHHRAEVWDRDDLEQLAGVQENVWSLDLCTSEFDRDDLRDLPRLPSMEILEHRHCRDLADPITAVARFARLRVLRIGPAGPAELLISSGPAAGGIESLDLSDLPPRPWGFRNLAGRVPSAHSLHLHATGPLWFDGSPPVATQELSLTAGRIEGVLSMPPAIDSVAVHVRDIDDAGITALLKDVQRIGALHLRGTPISADLAMTLPGRLGLGFLDIADTGIGREAVDAIATAYPQMRLLPGYMGRPPRQYPSAPE